MFKETKFDFLNTNWLADEEFQAEDNLLKLRKEWFRDSFFKTINFINNNIRSGKKIRHRIILVQFTTRHQYKPLANQLNQQQKKPFNPKQVQVQTNKNKKWA